MPEKTDGPGAGCPIRGVLDRIGDQWSLLTLEALESEKKRFNELLRDSATSPNKCSPRRCGIWSRTAISGAPSIPKCRRGWNTS